MKHTSIPTERLEAAKARIFQSGKTIGQVSDEIGHPRWLVSRLLNGACKATFGKSHDCAVALGLKDKAA